MPGIVSADTLVVRVGRMAAGVSDCCGDNAVLVAELRLHAPESPCREARDLSRPGRMRTREEWIESLIRKLRGSDRRGYSHVRCSSIRLIYDGQNAKAK